MPDIGIFELSIIAVIAIIVVKPDEWPALLRKVGYYYGVAHRYMLSAKNHSKQLYDDITGMDNLNDNPDNDDENDEDDDYVDPDDDYVEPDYDYNDYDYDDEERSEWRSRWKKHKRRRNVADMRNT